MENKKTTLRFGITAVWINLMGILFSGLLFPVLTAICCPQPQWENAALFIQSFHPLQTATFFCGYFLVLGSVLTFIVLYKMAEPAKKIYAMAGLLINVIFTAVVFLNYIIQTTYVPYLATNTPVETDVILPVFSMSNPGSFAWALEMWGWGGIGLSSFFMAAIFGQDRKEHWLRRLFWANGICSVGGAIVTSLNMNWLFSPAGFASLIIWNLLVLIIDLMLLRYLKMRYIEEKTTE